MKHLDQCQTIEGSVEIEQYEDALIQFDNLQKITGSLTIRKSPSLVRIEASNIHTIGEGFIMKELTSLSLISFPSLSAVKVLDWRVLPILSNVNFNNDIEDIESITVSDTSLVGFSGFMASNLRKLDINNNRFLDVIDSNVERIDGELHIAANAKELTVNLPNLSFANNVSLHEIFNINLKSLEEVNSTVSIVNNNFLDLKLPKLTTIGGTFNIFQNQNLKNLDIPELGEIAGGLTVVNNSQIDKINFLPKLYSIGGALEVIGDIKEITLKNLKLVKGSGRVKTISKSFDCNKWLKSEISTIIRGGKLECVNSENEKVLTSTPELDDTDYSTTFESGSLSFKMKLKFLQVISMVIGSMFI